MERSTLLWAAAASVAAFTLASLLGLAFPVRDLLSVPPPGPPPIAEGGWADYLAPEEACPGRRALRAPAGQQQAAVICLVNWARDRAGISPLPVTPLLMRSAGLKAADIARCEDFSHGACGRSPDAVFDDAGYRRGNVSYGENLALGGGYAGAPVDVVNGWLESDGHRRNLFDPRWTEQGIALLRVERFGDEPDARIWASHFGVRR